LPNTAGGLGTDLDPVDDEVYIKIVPSNPMAGETTIDWIDAIRSSDLTNPQAHVWPYFRVDTTIENGPFVRFKIYVGSDTPGDHTFEEVSYELLHTFDTANVFGQAQERPYYGFALFDGSETEPELDNHDYRAMPIVNYVKLEKLPETAPPTGACCHSEGGCTSGVISANCTGDNQWAEGESCSTFDCTTLIPTGAACDTLGNCFGGITEAFAILQGYGVCEVGDCSWQEGVSCVDRNCPEGTIKGSCCRPIPNSCIEDQTHNECSVYFGVGSPGQRWRSNTTCNEFQCPDIEDGACCLPRGCEILLESACLAQGGTYQGNHTDCVSDPCFGACCDGTTCSQTDQSTCEADGFTFLGYDISCTGPNPCLTPDPTGACCHPNNSCTVITEAACTNGATYQGDGTDCNPNPCPTTEPTGACCNRVTVNCVDGLTDADCTASEFRQWQGPGSTCATTTCPPVTGACCFAADDCRNNFTSAACSSAGGTWQGPNIQCVDELCVPADEITDTGLGIDPYVNADFNFKPEDLWRIEVGDEEYVTRVLYHMQEEVLASSPDVAPNDIGGSNNQIDFMFIVDHSATMGPIINSVQQAVPALAEDLVTKGFDARFGLIVTARGQAATPVPNERIACDNPSILSQYTFNGLQRSLLCHDEDPQDTNAGLQPGEPSGFTRSVDKLRKALDCWDVKDSNGFPTGAWTAPWSAIRYAVSHAPNTTTSLFGWRDRSEKFIFFVSDADDEAGATFCGDFLNDKSLAKDDLKNKLSSNVKFIPAVSIIEDEDHTNDTALYEDVALDSGWEGGIFNVTSTNYGVIFNAIVSEIDTTMRTSLATVIERAKSGTDGTFLKKAEIIITYEGDLTDLWTFNKSDFAFTDDHVPFAGTNTKGLTNFPFALSVEQIYGVESVHIQGVQSNWVSFGDEGPLNYDTTIESSGAGGGFGFRASGIGDPILVSTNSSRPKVFVNNRNQVIVAYENYSSGIPNIEIKGTGDFHQDSITGPKATRIQRFLTPSDFEYSHAITLPTTTIETTDTSDPYLTVEGTTTTTSTSSALNQLCDFIIDKSDITHIVWQSNASGYWEIYYANSSNMFIPVRLTKSNSRSSHPAISVDEAGSIFVVYHDDRFGPFNIMLASKDEERVIPLLEQDAYLASLKHKYTHYTNILPVLIDNPSGETPKLGQFWASKLADGAGNDQENAVYKLDETSGIPSDGVIGNSYHYLAFSSNSLYSVNLDGTLFRLAIISDKIITFLDTPENIGTVEKDISGFNNARILDMTVDNFDRVWILIFETAETTGPAFAMTSSGLPLISAFGINDRLRLIQSSSLDAATLATGIVFDGDVDTDTGSLGTGSITVTSDNKFHITFEQGGDNVLASSEYPLISGTTATFAFSVIGTFSIGLAVAMAHDVSDTLWVVTAGNDLYTLSTSDATSVFKTSLTAGSGSESALPVGTTYGIAFQDLEVSLTGSQAYFHIRLDFYDNIAFEGEPSLVVDSRENLEAFINEQVLDDPYIDVQGMNARGVLLEIDEIGVVFFDATHFVPGFSNLSQPYTFEPNQTYFARVFVLPSSGNLRESGVEQNNSFSCSKCSRFGNNNFNASSCSYSFVSHNNDGEEDLFFNYQIDFYADSGKQHLIRRFEAKPGSPDLAYMEVDNEPATSLWTNNGLSIPAGNSAFIQIHPVLDPQAGFLCGVQYNVHVNQCVSPDSECENYVAVLSGKWSSALVGDPFQNIDTDLNARPTDLIPGLSMSTFDGDIIMAWIDNHHNLLYGRFNGESWDIQTVAVPGRIRYCSIH